MEFVCDSDVDGSKTISVGTDGAVVTFPTGAGCTRALYARVEKGFRADV